MKTKIIHYIKHNIILLSIILLLVIISGTFIYKYYSITSKSSQTSNYSNSPEVKKSSTGICHQKEVSNYYEKTKNFTSYSSLEECLNSGGRLPKR